MIPYLVEDPIKISLENVSYKAANAKAKFDPEAGGDMQ